MGRFNKIILLMTLFTSLTFYNNCSPTGEESLSSNTIDIESDSQNQNENESSTDQGSSSNALFKAEELFTADSKPVRTVRNRLVIDDYDGDGVKDIYRKEDYWITIMSGRSGEEIRRFEYASFPKAAGNITRYVVDSIYIGEDYFIYNDAREDVFIYSIKQNSYLKVPGKDWKGINMHSMVRLGYWNDDDILDFGVIVYGESNEPYRLLVFDVLGNRLDDKSATELCPDTRVISIASWTGGQKNGKTFDVVLSFTDGPGAKTYLFENGSFEDKTGLDAYYKLFAIPDRNGDGIQEYGRITYPGNGTAIVVYDGQTLAILGTWTLPAFTHSSTYTRITEDNIGYDFLYKKMPVAGDVDDDGIQDFLMKARIEDPSSGQVRSVSLLVSGADFSSLGTVDGLITTFYPLQDIDGDGVIEVVVGRRVFKF